ncbi:STAS domain-containing protein [Bacillus massiliglaciei]|uniref:STAS domain-containing protein n=1 Tax=Bacillus massiliglaciei TaxID=1816693 RepID=UPI000DA61655|nr:STAS domain-containing protein [Bacillus massiliglaciei]
MLFKVESSLAGTVQYIGMIGVLDYSTVDSFDFVNETPDYVKEFIIDFSALEFIDSTGIGAILTILHKASSLQAIVTFQGMSEETVDLFETIGLYEIKKALLNEEV